MISPIGETRPNNAFTLVEILLVIIIAGIALALAAPNFSKGYSHFELNRTADDLLTVSRWAQAMAIGQERIYALSLDRDQGTYRLERAKVNEDELDGENSFEPVNGSLGRNHPVPAAIHLEMTLLSGSKETSLPAGGAGNIDRIEFYPDGTIDPATIQLVSPGQKLLLSSTEVRGMMTKVDSE